MFFNKSLSNFVFNIFSYKFHSHIISNKMSSFLKSQDNFKFKKKIKLNKKYFNLNNAKKNFGIGESSIIKICNKFGLNTRLKNLKLKLKTIQKIVKLVNKLTLKNSLKAKVFKIRNFTTKELKNYRGIRLILRYPVRGQRTHTNGKTRKFLKKKNYDLN